MIPTDKPLWFAAYTCAHHERRVSEQLRTRGIECFLPVYRAMHRWKDRRVELELPLFPGYIFVHLAVQEHFRVLIVPGVARIVGTSYQPTPLPNHEIQLLMDAKAREVRMEPYRFLTTGTRVRVKSGCFEGVEGFILRRKGLRGIVVTLKLISSAFVLDIDAADVELAPAVSKPPRQVPQGSAAKSTNWLGLVAVS
jgi:transcription termination/antitermination protein NusG